MEMIVSLIIPGKKFNNVIYKLDKSTNIGSFATFTFKELKYAQLFFDSLGKIELPRRRFTIVFNEELNRENQCVPVQDAILDDETNTVEVQTTIRL